MKNAFRSLFTLSPYREHGLLHIVICSTMMFVVLVFIFGLAYAIPLLSSSRPNFPPSFRVRLIQGAGLTFGGVVVYSLMYAYLGYNFYSPYRDTLSFKSAVVLWPLLWWGPVYTFCQDV